MRRRAGDKPARQRATRNRPALTGGSKCLVTTILPAPQPECQRALADLEDDLERARDILASAIESAAEGLGDFDYLFPDPEEPKDADWVSLYRRAIKALPELHDDASEAIATAFASFDWETKRALRAFRQAFVREKVS